ncbi:uncharacterized protein LOC143298985 [Babylonia areolata]|uniref:uncharacterized protein LOC143298985 n=1 Tax=Babylonia areolata TaxID=304850 RepID=UPI003FD1B42B
MAAVKAGGGAQSRKGRTGEVTVAFEPTVSNSDNSSSGNNNSNNSSSSATSAAQKNGGSVARLPSIKERRPSVQKKARHVSTIDAPSDSSTTTSNPQRRASVPGSSSSTLTPGGAAGGGKPNRPSFAGIGRRVSSMVRARMAFQIRRKPSVPAGTDANAPEDPNHMEPIHEMPRNPRFSAFLSPEAQYAVMKGYEDMLYEKIATNNPESRPVLKRNKTPFLKKISIVEDGEEDEQNKKKKKQKGDGGGGNTPSATPTSTAPSPDSDADTLVPPTSFMKTSRSHSTLSSDVVSKSVTAASLRHGGGGISGRNGLAGGGGAGFSLHRSSSLPSLQAAELSHRKRLVLTYRLESAMDILDTLKRRNMENSLSPRVFRIPRKVDAVRDFNCWTTVWQKEFKEVQRAK